MRERVAFLNAVELTATAGCAAFIVLEGIFYFLTFFRIQN